MDISMEEEDEEIIKLNVGGKLFMTLKSILMKSPWFAAFFSGKFKIKKTDKNEYFIDRDPDIFSIILTFLRDDKNINFSLFKEDKCHFDCFVKECKYFGMTIKKDAWPKKKKKYIYVDTIYSKMIQQIQKMTDDGYQLISIVSYFKFNVCIVFEKEI